MLISRQMQRRGTILPLLAVTCFSLFAFIALAVDIGMLMIARSECQDAADAAALIGARTLDNNVPAGVAETSYDNSRPAAVTAATNAAKANYLMQSKFAFSDSTVDKVEIGIYDYNSTNQLFQAIFPASNADPTQKLSNNGSIRPWTSCRVTVKGDQPTYFARIFGITSMPMSAKATSAHRPRDIAMVLDYSGSMNFGSTTHYPSGDGGSTGAVIGLLSTDPRYAQFGHYQRDNGRQSSNPNGSNNHPLTTDVGSYYTMSSGEILSASNFTYDSNGGPPMVNDFYASNLSDPTVAPLSSNLVSAFNSPSTVLPKDTSYNTQAVAFGTTTIGPLGDRWPCKGGKLDATGISWDPTVTNGAARNAAELVEPAGDGINAQTAATRNIPGSRPAIANGNRTEGGSSWANFYDNAWELKGYDLDIDRYSKASGPNAAYSQEQLRTTELFQGYTIGPGYLGKTFFIWPPDPRDNSAADPTRPSATQGSFDTSNRAMCDWCRRFFKNGSGNAWNPQTYNINGTLFNTTNGGHVLSTTSSNFRVNYPAVLAWLKSGPQVLPGNLRAGRILYYTSIPDDCTNPSTQDQWFWREYIDYVLGVTANRSCYNPAYCLAGTEGNAGDSWSTKFSITATSAYTPASSPTNPKPYMCYTDVINMPRTHFWFGPQSMIAFLTPRGGFSGSVSYNWNPGTSHEAHDWQLKAAINSAIDDIRKNHPNDQAGLSIFAWANFKTPRVAMGQDWDRLKAALFFNYSYLDAVVAGTAQEGRPYTISSGSISSTMVGDLPNANGGTDPNTGFMLAYNMLSSSNASGAGGRRGATKIVIFETDGVPNSYQTWNFSSAGTNSQYVYSSNGSNPGNGDSTCMNNCYNVVNQICNPTTASNPGFDLPNSVARVYPFAFGDMFESTCTSSFKPTALTFLQTIAYDGNTSSSTSAALPPEQVITGDYNTRIANLRTGLEKVLQSGVQVTLIE